MCGVVQQTLALRPPKANSTELTLSHGPACTQPQDVLSACFVGNESLITGCRSGELLLWDMGGRRAGSFGSVLQVRAAPWVLRVCAPMFEAASCAPGAAALLHTPLRAPRGAHRPMRRLPHYAQAFPAHAPGPKAPSIHDGQFVHQVGHNVNEWLKYTYM